MKNLSNKYRPRCFEEILSQDSVLYSLRSAITNNDILNAYVVCGPFGNGKTTLARIMAKSFNCVNFKKNRDICNECEGCKYALLEGSETDSSSKRGINEIKELIERFMPLPMFCRFRTLILDEAHMLTNDAFGYLLKVLEEPPMHMIFILVTTEYSKLPDTIKSRCAIINMSSATNEIILSMLKSVCEKENIKLNDNILSFICRRSCGSFRNALNLLQQMQFVTTEIENTINFETDENLLHLYDLLKLEWDDVINFMDLLHRKGLQTASFLRSFLNFVVDKKLLCYNYILEVYFEVMPYEESCSGEKFFWVHTLYKLWKIFHH